MIPLFIPYVNRPDLLDKAIRSTWRGGAEVNVFNNSGKYIDCDSCGIEYNPIVPLTFSQTQNAMLKMALGKDYNPPSCVWIKDPFYLFMHSDAEAGEGTVKKLLEMAQSLTEEGRKWAVIFTAYDALAAFNTAAFREVGGWDQYLEWYASDQDMYRRLKLAGYELIESNLPVKHEPSQTLKADPEIRRKVDLMFPCRQAYYYSKWGGPADHETFLTPFGK
jgi:hypothetical protein